MSNGQQRARVDLIDGVPFIVYPCGISCEADPRDPQIAAIVAEIKRRSAVEKRKMRLGCLPCLPGHYELIGSVEQLEKDLESFK